MPDYAHLMTRQSREEYLEAAEYIVKFPEEIAILYSYFTSGSEQDRKRSAWLLQHVSDLDASVFKPWQDKFLDYAPSAKTDAEKRFITRLFSKHGLPQGEELQGKLLKLTFDWILDPNESIAVNAFCLTNLHRFCKIHPELENELREIIADQFPRGTAAFKSRARHILKDLSRAKLK